MRHGVRWAAECALLENKRNYWARATLGIELLTSGTKRYVRLTRTRLRSRVTGSLSILAAATMPPTRPRLPPCRGAGSHRRAYQTPGKNAPYQSREPRHVVLFSGHMVDSAERKTSRFPEAKTDAARRRLARDPGAVRRGARRPRDFRRSLRRRPAVRGSLPGSGLAPELRLPLLENEFLDASVNFAARSLARSLRSGQSSPTPRC